MRQRQRPLWRLECRDWAFFSNMEKCEYIHIHAQTRSDAASDEPGMDLRHFFTRDNMAGFWSDAMYCTWKSYICKPIALARCKATCDIRRSISTYMQSSTVSSPDREECQGLQAPNQKPLGAGRRDKTAKRRHGWGKLERDVMMMRRLSRQIIRTDIPSNLRANQSRSLGIDGQGKPLTYTCM